MLQVIKMLTFIITTWKETKKREKTVNNAKRDELFTYNISDFLRQIKVALPCLHKNN